MDERPHPVRTYKLAATDSLPERIVAKDTITGESSVVNIDYALDNLDNHGRAVRALHKRVKKIEYSESTTRGYLFYVTPDEEVNHE